MGNMFLILALRTGVGVGEFNGVIYTLHRSNLVAMVTSLKILTQNLLSLVFYGKYVSDSCTKQGFFRGW